MELSSDQESAISTIIDWYNSSNRSPYITLGGYAGTGKTTVVAELRQRLDANLKVCYCAYTGKATSVLRNKLNLTKSIYRDDVIGTIHSLIYVPVMDGDTIIDWQKINNLDFDLIIIDESSMVSRDIFDDLLSFEIPIICLGDHGQLPPVSNDDFNLMKNPQIKLEKIHRYDSSVDSPLLKVSMLAREEGYIPFGQYGKGVFKVDPKSSVIPKFVSYMGDFSNSFCVVGFNNTRIKMNKKFRAVLKRNENCPEIGDRVICLRNNTKTGSIPIYNGMISTIKDIEGYNKKCYYARCEFDGEKEYYTGFIVSNGFNSTEVPYIKVPKYEIKRWIKQRTCGDYYSVNNNIVRTKEMVPLDNFDYAYAITCHKSQGSEMDNVMVIEEKCSYWDKDDMWNRWLYTAVTRSRKNLMIVASR